MWKEILACHWAYGYKTKSYCNISCNKRLSRLQRVITFREKNENPSRPKNFSLKFWSNKPLHIFVVFIPQTKICLNIFIVFFIVQNKANCKIKATWFFYLIINMFALKISINYCAPKMTKRQHKNFFQLHQNALTIFMTSSCTSISSNFRLWGKQDIGYYKRGRSNSICPTLRLQTC